jgi:hypothetical protein
MEQNIIKRGRGRPRGYVVKSDSRQKISENNAWRSMVITPDGEFHSMAEAARFYKISPMLVSYRCKLGAQQREFGHDGSTSNTRDYRGWHKTDPVRNNIAPRPVRVPWGEFPSLNSAARAGKVSISKLRHAINSGRLGYEYI